MLASLIQANHQLPVWYQFLLSMLELLTAVAVVVSLDLLKLNAIVSYHFDLKPKILKTLTHIYTRTLELHKLELSVNLRHFSLNGSTYEWCPIRDW